MKKCRTCGIDKPLGEYDKHPAMPDGYNNHCKSCQKEKRKLRESDPVIRIRKNKYARKFYKERNYQSTYNSINPEKSKARSLCEDKVESLNGFDKHHWNYNKGFACDIIYLNRKEHLNAHKYMIYNAEKMMYMTPQGELLNTKEKHIEYIKSLKIW